MNTAMTMREWNMKQVECEEFFRLESFPGNNDATCIRYQRIGVNDNCTRNLYASDDAH